MCARKRDLISELFCCFLTFCIYFFLLHVLLLLLLLLLVLIYHCNLTFIALSVMPVPLFPGMRIVTFVSVKEKAAPTHHTRLRKEE